MNRDQAIGIVEKFVAQCSTPDNKEFCVGGKFISIKELLQELQRGTEIGEEYIRSIQELAEAGLDYDKNLSDS